MNIKTASYGRIVFGISAALCGFIALLWPNFDNWQHLRILWTWAMQFGSVISAILAIGQIAGGIGILFARTARAASIVLGADYALLALACIHGMIAAPAVYQQYGSFFEQFAPACGAIAVYALTVSNAARSATLGRTARVGLGLCAASFALDQAFYLRETAMLVPVWIPPSQMFWAICTTIAFALAAIAMIADFQARLAASLMTLMLALFGIVVWIPILVAKPNSNENWSEFALTLLIAGAAWSLAAFQSLRIAPRSQQPRAASITSS